MEYSESFNELMESEFFKHNPEFISVLFKYFTARFDLKNFGGKDNNLIILENSDSKSFMKPAKWYTNDEGVGWVVKSKKGSIDLKIKFINDGTFKLSLKGLDFRDRNRKRINIFLDYTKLIINEICVFDSNLCISHDKDYTYEKLVKNGEIMNIHIEWMPLDTPCY